ncbi:peptide chain release factor N(5)-glutamine methyltransferase [Sphingomonas sp. 1P06PA]|uniref:peptide chain release factor N(5)-glutamine methyltransferase n=1 Tax=Sphingomonas sp. 1P06PA TaxID=554121 RepID=UPI0039A4FA7A
MVTRAAAIATAAARLAEASATPRLDAELLMAHQLGTSREAMLLAGLQLPVATGYDDLVARRADHEPMAYILGERDFWTITLKVTPGVLVPRPDSETLIEAAVASFAGRTPPATILDLGTGSGALLLAALDQWRDAIGIGVDSSPRAVAIAADNARRLRMGARATIVEGGWDAVGGRFDLILCNPPYIESGADLPREVADHEPPSALYAGPDGLDDYRAIAPLIPERLAPGGVACIEIGAGQAHAASVLFAQAGLAVAVRRDLAGHDRCLIVTQRDG